MIEVVSLLELQHGVLSNSFPLSDKSDENGALTSIAPNGNFVENTEMEDFLPFGIEKGHFRHMAKQLLTKQHLSFLVDEVKQFLLMQCNDILSFSYPSG